MTLQPGTRLGSYEITSLLGSGGMGQVYRAKDHKLGRDVAIKVLREELAQDPERLRRFEQEARSASALNHPNIITIHDIRLRQGYGGQVGDEEDVDFIVMELVVGKTLREMLAEGPLPTKTLLQLATQTAEGLAKAHSAGIVHRDLKPENLMVSSDGYVKILDFGLAKLLPQPGVDSDVATITKEGTVAGAVMGTASYMSPEQALGNPLDARTDIFSLGAVLYEMATGTKPFRGETPARLFDQILHQALDSPSSLNKELPSDFDKIVGRALEKDPQDRYRSARELLDVIRAVRLDSGLPEAMGQKSIVVLPFENISPDPEQEYFCDGMTEEIITDLSKIQSLRVISRTSSMRLKGTDKEIGTIGKELNVQYVLEGSVRKAGNNLRITAQLIDSTNDAHLWAEKYSGTIEDVFDFQEKVSRSIAKSLELNLSLQDKELLSKRTTGKTEAYESYLKGRYFWNKRTPEGLRTALEFFKESVDLDPGYAPAYSGLADAYNLLGILLVIPPNEAHPLAKAAANRALEIDDTLAEAHVSLALVSFVFDWNWDVAEREFLRAIELSPSNASAHHFYGAYYVMFMKRYEEALEEMRHAYELDPLTPVHSADTGCVFLFSRRYNEAIQQCLETLGRFPEFPVTYYYLIITYVLQRRYEEALAASRKATVLTGDHPMYLSTMGYTLAAAGRKDEAYSILERLKDDKADLPVPPYQVALIHNALGEHEIALDWLEKAQKEHTWQACYMHLDPCLDPLRSNPRFKDLLLRMNLPE